MRRPRWVDSPRYSTCGSCMLNALDFSTWYTDNFFAPLYLHVAGPDESFHRVYPRKRKGYTVRLAAEANRLRWIYDKAKPAPGGGEEK